MVYSEWESLDPQIFRKLYESIPEEISLLIQTKGRKTKFHVYYSAKSLKKNCFLQKVVNNFA